jgi:hypothetical protein
MPARLSVTGHRHSNFEFVRSQCLLGAVRRFCRICGRHDNNFAMPILPNGTEHVAHAATILGTRAGKGLLLAKTHRRKRIWRSATACVAAYALVLYAILWNLTPLSVEALGATASGLEICLHPRPAAPAGHSNAGEHCNLCLANCHPTITPPTPPICVVAYASKLRWAVIADDFAFLPTSVSARPRGPPLSA